MVSYDYEGLKALAAGLRVPVATLLVLSSTNDPFYAGLPSNRRDAEWFGNLWRQVGLAGGSKTHLRAVHYKLISQDPPVTNIDGSAYGNTQADWKDAVSASGSARTLGLVDPDQLIDMQAAEPVVADERPAKDADLIVVDGDSIREMDVTDLSDLPVLHLTTPVVRQRYMVEVWIEKSTMNAVLRRLQQRYDINFVAGVGEISITRCRQLVARVKADRRPCRILYVSDHDPGGRSMPVAVARKIEFQLRSEGLDLDIQVRHVMLTPEQLERYDLPRIDIKETEVRAGRFESRFGPGAVELDALEALYPGEIEKILTREIRRYRDTSLDARVYQAADIIKNGLSDINRDVHDRYAERVTVVRSRYAELAERFNAEISVLRAEWEAIQDDIEADLDDKAPDLDHIEWPEPNGGDEDADALFDSRRSYLEQIKHYKRFQGKSSWCDVPDPDDSDDDSDVVEEPPRPVPTIAYDKSVDDTIRELQSVGMSVRRIATELNDRGIGAPRGGPWSGGQIDSVLRRLRKAA